MRSSCARVPYVRPLPSYRLAAGEVAAGWSAPVAGLPLGPLVLAVDGPAALDWAALAEGLATAVRAAGRDVDLLDVRDHYAPGVGERLTAEPVPADDPFFTPLSQAQVADLFDSAPRPGRPTRDAVRVVYGPGASLCEPDLLWYADLPKRYAEAAVSKGELPVGVNLGRPAQPGDLVRLFYTDWPVLDRHRDAIAGRVDRWIDTQHPARPASLDGAALRATLAHLARGPVRTRPYFNSTPWGGRWAASELGFTPQGGNTALGYELIAPRRASSSARRTGHRSRSPSSSCASSTRRRCSVTRCTAGSAPPSPSASTTSTRWAAATCPCTFTRGSGTCGRCSAGRTPSTRRITSPPPRRAPGCCSASPSTRIPPPCGARWRKPSPTAPRCPSRTTSSPTRRRSGSCS